MMAFWLGNGNMHLLKYYMVIRCNIIMKCCVEILYGNSLQYNKEMLCWSGRCYVKDSSPWLICQYVAKFHFSARSIFCRKVSPPIVSEAALGLIFQMGSEILTLASPSSLATLATQTKMDSVPNYYPILNMCLKASYLCDFTILMSNRKFFAALSPICLAINFGMNGLLVWFMVVTKQRFLRSFLGATRLVSLIGTVLFVALPFSLWCSLRIIVTLDKTSDRMNPFLSSSSAGVIDLLTRM